ncbi:APL3 [Acrasis kona]|uniref:APL3 n=1 Tax=Acrasis kona TaxID=1008807 RepID=A0AAW2ZD13_9EUKA
MMKVVVSAILLLSLLLATSASSSKASSLTTIMRIVNDVVNEPQSDIFKSLGNKVKNGVHKAARNTSNGVKQTTNRVTVVAKVTTNKVAVVAKESSRKTATFTVETAKKAKDFAEKQARNFIDNYILSYKKILVQGAKVGEQASDGGKKFSGTTRDSFRQFGGAVGSGTKDSAKFVGMAAVNAVGFAGTAKNTIEDFVKAIKIKPKKILGYVKKFVKDKNGAIADIKRDLKEQFEAYKKVLEKAATKFKNQVKKFKDDLNRASKALREGLNKKFASAKNALQKLGEGIKNAGKDFVKLYEEVDKLFMSHPLLQMIKSLPPIGLIDNIKLMVKYGKDGNWAQLVLCVLDSVGDVAQFLPGIGPAVSTGMSAATGLARFAIAMKEGDHETAVRSLAGIKLPGGGKVLKTINRASKTAGKGMNAYDQVKEVMDSAAEPGEGPESQSEDQEQDQEHE